MLRPSRPKGRSATHGLGAGPTVAGFAVAFASGKVDVEHMQLVVARGDLTFGDR